MQLDGLSEFLKTKASFVSSLYFIQRAFHDYMFQLKRLITKNMKTVARVFTFMRFFSFYFSSQNFFLTCLQSLTLNYFSVKKDKMIQQISASPYLCSFAFPWISSSKAPSIYVNHVWLLLILIFLRKFKEHKVKGMKSNLAAQKCMRE